MEILTMAGGGKRIAGRSIAGIAAVSALLMGGAAFAEDSYSMAPPIQTEAPQTFASTAADSVFRWDEVPVDEQVPITRASFDQGGYQLYDTRGETIIVPFTNQNLYVMKFGQSNNGGMYFVNEGGTPVLYVPRDGYVENATVDGARWYPFGKDFHPSRPVFLGVAPSWSVFVGMGWYPHMACYGGYWSERPWIVGDIFTPSIGLFFVIGGHSYHGWDGYRAYCYDHPHFYRTDYYRREFYHWDRRPLGPAHQFRSYSHGRFDHRGFDGGRWSNGGNTFNGGSDRWQRSHGGDGGFRSNRDPGRTWHNDSPSGGRVFRGGDTNWSGSHGTTGDHTWNSGDRASTGHTWSNGDQASGDHTWSGGDHASGGHSWNTGDRASGGHTWSGGDSGGTSHHTYSGGGSSGSGRRSGGDSGSGGHTRGSDRGGSGGFSRHSRG